MRWIPPLLLLVVVAGCTEPTPEPEPEVPVATVAGLPGLEAPEGADLVATTPTGLGPDHTVERIAITSVSDYCAMHEQSLEGEDQVKQSQEYQDILDMPSGTSAEQCERERLRYLLLIEAMGPSWAAGTAWLVVELREGFGDNLPIEPGEYTTETATTLHAEFIRNDNDIVAELEDLECVGPDAVQQFLSISLDPAVVWYLTAGTLTVEDVDGRLGIELVGGLFEGDQEEDQETFGQVAIEATLGSCEIISVVE